MMPETTQVDWSFRQPPDGEPADEDALLAALARLLWTRAKKRRESTPEGMEEPDAVAG
jgi:hypothetical protein